MEATLSGLVLDGKYRLTVPLGEGGMGVVYAAQHVLLGKPLAVKLLKPRLVSEPVALARFQQEAVQVSRIGSPHIVQVLDLGSAPDGSPFMVMELLEGETLYALLMENPAKGTNEVLPVPRSIDIVSQILAGLDAAHVRGIVHRDLKPGNVFLTRVGDRMDFVKLLDFGLSKVLGGDRIAHMTRTGVLLGTPTYMAPEQVLARKDVDHRADLWATGIVLFRMLVGRRPHEGRSAAERMAAITTIDAPLLRHFRPELDPRLEAVIRKALARSPGERFQSAEEFRAALAPWTPAPYASASSASVPAARASGPIVATPPPPPVPAPLARSTPAIPPTVAAVAPTVVSVPPTVVSVPPTVVSVAPTVLEVAPFAHSTTSVPPTLVSVAPTVIERPAAAAPQRSTAPGMAAAPAAVGAARSRLLLWLGAPAALVVIAAVVLLLARPWESPQTGSAVDPVSEGAGPSERPPDATPAAVAPEESSAPGPLEGTPVAPEGASESKTIITISVPRPGAPDAALPPARNSLVPSIPSGAGDGEDAAAAAEPASDAVSVPAGQDAGRDARRDVGAAIRGTRGDPASGDARARPPIAQPPETGGGTAEPTEPRNNTSDQPLGPVGEVPPEEDPGVQGGNQVGSVAGG
ncbi:MAG: protein kinase [Deltaproteobacteria bacterium]|nr:protein kinase [Deltaproteobacteria bacterium]